MEEARPPNCPLVTRIEPDSAGLNRKGLSQNTNTGQVFFRMVRWIVMRNSGCQTSVVWTGA